MSTLVEFWRKCRLDCPPFIHPDDREGLESKNPNLVEKHFDQTQLSFQTFIGGDRFGNAKDNRFYSALLPAPYMGSLDDAEIIILMLNPGFEYVDYYAEDCSPEREKIRSLRKKMIMQEVSDLEFPFGWLDPQYCWHSGFVYWERKLRGVLKEIANTYFDDRYLCALKEMSKRVATLQLVPYHSEKFKAHSIVEKLPSVSKARDYAHWLAEKSDKLIIVPRKRTGWGLNEGPRTVLYDGHEALGASLGLNSKGGKAILEQFCSRPPNKSICL